MAKKCDGCGATLLLAECEAKGYEFCSHDCHDNFMLRIAANIPQQQLTNHVAKVHSGPCEECGGDGPSELYTAHTVISVIIFTFGSSKDIACCKRCGVRAVLVASGVSMVAGWWGFPWGLATPFQIARNLLQIFGSPKPGKPSQDFIEHTSIKLAAAKVRPKNSQPANPQPKQKRPAAARQQNPAPKKKPPVQ